MLHIASHAVIVSGIVYWIYGGPVATLVAAALLTALYFTSARDYLDGVSGIQLRAAASSFVHGIIELEPGLKIDDVRGMAERHLITHRRFRSRVRTVWWWWSWWEEDPDFELDRHLHEHKQSITHQQLENWLTESCSRDLDWDHPPFELHVFARRIGGTEASDSSVLIIKFHHCMADGFAMLRAIFQGVEHDPASLSPPTHSRTRPTPTPTPAMGVNAARVAVSSTTKLLLLPQDTPSALKSDREFVDINHPLCVRMHQLQTTVDQVKAAGKATGASVNDILLSATTAALARFERDITQRTSSLQPLKPRQQPQQQQQQQQLEQQQPRRPSSWRVPMPDPLCVLWVSLRPLSHLFVPHTQRPLEWGNGGLGAVYVQLPAAMARAAVTRREAGAHSDSDGGRTGGKAAGAGGSMGAGSGAGAGASAEQLYRALITEVHARTTALIGSPEPVLAHALLALFGLLHPLIGVPLFHLVAYKTTISMSNMPGPQFPCAIAGRAFRSLSFFVPPVGYIGTFLCIFTYNGRISVTACCATGERRADEVHRFVYEHMEQELGAVVKAAGEA